jgi:hypothetical protein
VPFAVANLAPFGTVSFVSFAVAGFAFFFGCRLGEPRLGI